TLDTFANPIKMDDKVKAATQEILDFKDFAFAKDTSDTDSYGQTISEAQGTRIFCKKVVSLTSKYPNALAPYYLRDQQMKNPDLFRILQLKRLGHAFNLGTDCLYNFQKGIVMTLEGFNDTFTLPMLTSSFACCKTSRIR